MTDQEARRWYDIPGAPDYWCHVCNRGAEGCTHPIEDEYKETR